MSAFCLDYVDFRWPEGVEVFAAAHPFDDISQEELSSNPDAYAIQTVSIPAVALVVPTAPDQLVLKLEFGRSYLYAALCAFQYVVLFSLTFSRSACLWTQNLCILLIPALHLKPPPQNSKMTYHLVCTLCPRLPFLPRTPSRFTLALDKCQVTGAFRMRPRIK
jgi:hypothetical protein